MQQRVFFFYCFFFCLNLVQGLVHPSRNFFHHYLSRHIHHYGHFFQLSIQPCSDHCCVQPAELGSVWSCESPSSCSSSLTLHLRELEVTEANARCWDALAPCRRSKGARKMLLEKPSSSKVSGAVCVGVKPERENAPSEP